MVNQLTRHRNASGFDPSVTVAAKSGGLMGIVRNEVGVVTYPNDQQYAVAVFTRSASNTSAAVVNAGIGRIARLLVENLRS